MAEAFGYSTTLRSMTQGQGTFSMEFAKYKKVPNSIQEAIVKEPAGSRPPLVRIIKISSEDRSSFDRK